MPGWRSHQRKRSSFTEALITACLQPLTTTPDLPVPNFRLPVKPIILSLFVFIAAYPGIAQNEAANWYFGNGVGISFLSGKPVVLNDGKMYTEEGCASISDGNGRLLFYTDGITVWNRNHAVMSNGTGLKGHTSSTQSAIIVPLPPGNTGKYYVFTVYEKGGKNGLNYSVIDMTTNGGQGSIILKNKQLLTPTSEKLTAIRHANEKDAWIITHQWNSDAFYAYPLTTSGIGKPVISKIGMVHKNYGSGNNGEAIGYLKGSPDGKKLCSAICYLPNSNVEILDFNNVTGEISNLVNIPSGGYAYGLCFSPDNSKLYISYLKGAVGIKQYDLNSSDIWDSEVIITRSEGISFFGAMQQGPDGKIYISRSEPWLDVIERPDQEGLACRYKKAVLDLGMRSSTYGLPNFISLTPPLNLGNDTAICGGSLTLNAGIPGAAYLWSTGENTRSISVSKTGVYWVAINTGSFSKPKRDTINVTVDQPLAVIDLGGDTSLYCVNDYLIDAYAPIYDEASYLWSTGDSTSEITVTKSGKYFVTVTRGACSATGDVKVDFKGKPTVFRALKWFNPGKGFVNTSFEFTINDVDEFEMIISDQKGRQVYRSKDVNERWKGKDKKGNDVPRGIYQWEVRYKSKCSGNKDVSKTGEVSLIRE